MPKTDPSPLSIIQKQAEVTKKAVEKLLKECNKVIKDKKLKDKEVKQRQLFKECFQLKKDVVSVHGRAEKLSKEDEPKKVKNYDNKRDFEVKRLANLQNQLATIMPKLAPEEDEEAFTKELKEAGEISDTPVNEEEEEEEEEESEEEDQTDNAVTQENQGEIKDSPKDEKKDKKGKDKDKDKKGKEKDKKDKDKKGKDKDKKKKDKKDEDDENDEEDEEEEDKDDKAKDKKNKDKDKKNAKGKDKKEKDKKDKKKNESDDDEEEDDDEDKKKNKDKKKDKDKKKEKDKKDKDKDEKKNMKVKVEVHKEEVKDLNEESEEEEEDEDIEEAIEGDDEEDFEETEDEEDHAVVKSVRKQDAKQVQAKTSPKDQTDYVETLEYEDSEEDSEEEEDSEVEDVIQPEKAKVITSTPKPASRTFASMGESSKTVNSTIASPSSSSENKTESSNAVSSASQSKTPQPASRSTLSKPSSSSSKEVSKIESKKDEADHEDEEEDESEEEEEEEGEEEEGEEEEGEEEEESEEEDDEDEDEESEEDEEDSTKVNDTLEVTQGVERFVALDDFDAVEKGDLSVKKDEVIRIIEVREDGWWVAENDAGKQGLVPKTYLKVYNQYSSIQQHDEDDREDGEESEQEGEEKEDGEKTPHSKRRSGRELWGSLKKTVNETLVTDVLHAMGAGPPGFRLPTLSKYFNESEKFRMKNFLAPKLSESNLGYRDLLFNPATGEMRAVEVRLERVITITSCQQIPPPATGIIVQRRYVRMCLFDGQNVLSNIHTIRVAAEDKSERNWSFNSKISDLMDVQLHNEFFIRSNSTNSNIGVLFELCISCVKSVNEKSEERGEFSCGWVHLPLTDKTGVPIANKSYDLYVHGGTPYERDVEVDPSVSRRASSNALVTLISGNKQPRLLVKVSVPNREQKTQLDLLPEILVGDMCLLPFYTYYRQILADTLIIKRLDLDSTESIHSPFLRQFPEVADHPDLMSLFRETWVNKLKAVKRAEKKDIEAMKVMFDNVFKESVYPVITTASFVPYKTGNTEIEMKRKNVIEKFSQIKRERKSALAALLASDIVYTPFDMSEVTFNIINPYSLADKFIPIPVES